MDRMSHHCQVMKLEKTLAYHDNEYAKKRKLWAKVAKLIKKNGYHPDSLIPETQKKL